MSKLKCVVPLALAMMMSATPALAQSDWCVTPPPLPTTCTTLAIRANASGHFIYFRIGAWTSFRLRDIETNVVVRSGGTGAGTHQETVFGLYGWYELSVRGVAATGYISNT